MGQYVKHKRSSTVINGAPKLPTKANIGIGEIAINFAEGYETLSILNSASGVATFSSDEIIEAKIPNQASIENSGFTKNAGTLTGVTVNGTQATVSNGMASVNVSGLPPVTSSDNGKVLAVVNGQWSAATPVTVYSGNIAPDNVLGNNGDIYLQTS